MIAAKVILDSVSRQEHRPTSFELVYPKFIHGEFMTHRVISRNASSSRAIPTAKLIAEVRDDATRASPVFWGKNQPGMQAAVELKSVELTDAQIRWRDAALYAAHIAEEMTECGVHKQIVNRVLEPFSHIRVVATATEWDNFFGLRLHRDAQPEMRALAHAMWEAYRASTPMLLEPGDWHLPYVGHMKKDTTDAFDGVIAKVAKKVSVARCARVSYRSFDTDKNSTEEEDLKLYDRLVGAQPLHASPAEHQCTPDEAGCTLAREGETRMKILDLSQWANPDEHGNFVGWRQFRKMLPGEARAPLPKEYEDAAAG